MTEGSRQSALVASMHLTNLRESRLRTHNGVPSLDAAGMVVAMQDW